MVSVLRAPHALSRQNRSPRSAQADRMLRILRFAQAAAAHAADGCANVSKEQLEARLAACEKCEFRHGLMCQHQNCGCFIWLKARLRSESCPATPPRWPAVIS